MKRRDTGGWYCTECGATTQRLPSGAVTCAACGALGLRGCNRPPRRVACPEAGCTFSGWDDGGVNDDLPRHLRRAHGIPQPCTVCKATGTRRSKAKDAIDGRKPCWICRGKGAYA